MPAKQIILNVVNNTNYPLVGSLLGGLQDPNRFNINSFNEYLWDVTGVNFSNTSIFTIQYKVTGAASFSVATGLTYGSFYRFMASLNDLNLGLFNPVAGLYQAGPIVTYNDAYVFGDIDIN